MITDFDNLTRNEFIQYIIYVYQSFLVRYDYFTKEEEEYMNDLITRLKMYCNI